MNPYWLRVVLAGRSKIVVAVGRIKFASDFFQAVCLSPITAEERTTLLLWQIVTHAQPIWQRNAIEDTLLERFDMALVSGIRATVLCGWGFYDQALDHFLGTLKLNPLSRVRTSPAIR